MSSPESLGACISSALRSPTFNCVPFFHRCLRLQLLDNKEGEEHLVADEAGELLKISVVSIINRACYKLSHALGNFGILSIELEYKRDNILPPLPFTRAKVVRITRLG